MTSMSFPLQIKLEGLKPIQDALAKAPATIKTVVHKVAEEEARKIVVKAKKIVPVRTGALRASIYHKTTGFLGFEIGAAIYYAGFVEYGTRYMRARPYLRPAIEEKLPEIRKALKDAIIEKILEETR